MMLPINVKQFEFGNQGREKEIGTVVRKVHRSSYYGPTPSGCCAGTVTKHTYLWIEYRGEKYVLKPTHHWPSFIGPVAPYEIILPGTPALCPQCISYLDDSGTCRVCQYPAGE